MQYVHNYQGKQGGVNEHKEEGVAGTKSLENYAPQFRATQQGGGATQPPSVSAVADELALQPHEQHDIHINVTAATTVHPSQAPNVDHDAFFLLYKSPYKTPAYVERFRPLFFIFTTFVRIVFLIWFPVLLVGLILCRYHYRSVNPSSMHCTTLHHTTLVHTASTGRLSADHCPSHHPLCSPC
jgi:hypothetical protein